MNYLERLNSIPPPICRLIAVERYNGPLQRPKRPYRMMRMIDIAAKGGLTLQRASWVAKQKTFNRVPVEDAERFRLGCGIRPENEWYVLQFVKRIFENKELLAELFDHPPDGRPRSLRKILKRL